MNPVELRLRQRIDLERDRRFKAEALLKEARAVARRHGIGTSGRKLSRCVWCGAGCYGLTCKRHVATEKRWREAVGA